MSMKVLVTGSRDFTDYERVRDTLERYFEYAPADGMIVIHGNARGADNLADVWAKQHANVTVVRVPADWGNDGKGAGPIRNRRMLELQPDYVVAFYKEGAANKGTQHMVTLAGEKNLPVFAVRA